MSSILVSKSNILIYLQIPQIVWRDEPNCINNFKCRFCDFDAAGGIVNLRAHYIEIHRVETKKDEETGTMKIYQGGEVIATYGTDHKYCCITNCINGRKPNMEKYERERTPKMAIRLKRGGDYASISKYFEGYFEGGSYFDAPTGIFVCIDHLEENTKDNVEIIKLWVMTYGVLATFKLKQLKEIKNRNLIIIGKTPLPKNVVFVKETIIKCGVSQSKADLIEENKRLTSIIADLSHSLKTANDEKNALKMKNKEDNEAKCLEIQRMKEALRNAGFPLVHLSTGEIDLNLRIFKTFKRQREEEEEEAKQSTSKKLKTMMGMVGRKINVLEDIEIEKSLEDLEDLTTQREEDEEEAEQSKKKMLLMQEKENILNGKLKDIGLNLRFGNDIAIEESLEEEQDEILLMTPGKQNLLDKGLEESGLSLEDLDNILVSELPEEEEIEQLNASEEEMVQEEGEVQQENASTEEDLFQEAKKLLEKAVLDVDIMLTEKEDRKEMVKEITQSISEEIVTEVVSRPTKKQPSLSKYPKLTMSAYFSFLEQ